MTFGEQFEECLGEKGVEMLLSFLPYDEYEQLFVKWVASHSGVDAVGYCNECDEEVDIEWDSEPLCGRCRTQQDYEEEQFQKGKDMAYAEGQR